MDLINKISESTERLVENEIKRSELLNKISSKCDLDFDTEVYLSNLTYEELLSECEEAGYLKEIEETNIGKDPQMDVYEMLVNGKNEGLSKEDNIKATVEEKPDMADYIKTKADEIYGETITEDFDEEILDDETEGEANALIKDIIALQDHIKHTVDDEMISLNARIETLNNKIKAWNIEEIETDGIYSNLTNVMKDLEFIIKESDYAKEDKELNAKNESEDLSEATNTKHIHTFTVYTKHDEVDTWLYNSNFDTKEEADAKADELRNSGFDVEVVEHDLDVVDNEPKFDLDKYTTVDEIKNRIKEINDELAYCRRRDRVSATFGAEQQVYELNKERDALRTKLKQISKIKNESEDLTADMKIKDWYSALAPEDYQLDKINPNTTFADLKKTYDETNKINLSMIGDIDSDPRNTIITAMADLYDLPTNDIEIVDESEYPKAAGTKDFSDYGIGPMEEWSTDWEKEFSDYLRDKYGTDDIDIITTGSELTPDKLQDDFMAYYKNKATNESEKLTETDNPWTTGVINHNGKHYEYSAKVFDTPSEYGIDKGRVSKLWIKDLDDGSVYANYDRGWDIEPEDKSLYDVIMNKVLNEADDYKDWKDVADLRDEYEDTVLSKADEDERHADLSDKIRDEIVNQMKADGLDPLNYEEVEKFVENFQSTELTRFEDMHEEKVTFELLPLEGEEYPFWIHVFNA